MSVGRHAVAATKAIVMNTNPSFMNPSSTNPSSLITLLDHDGPLSPEQHEHFRRACAQIARTTSDDVARLLAIMLQSAAAADDVWHARCDAVLGQLVLRQRQAGDPLSVQSRQQISLLHNRLGKHSPCRWRLLQWLATAASAEDLRLFVELVVASPPPDGQVAAVAMAPLFQRTNYDPAALFPRLLEALQHLSLAAPVLDLSNYLVRTRRVNRHPSEGRLEELVALLGNIVQRLSELEAPGNAGESREVIRHQVDEGVAIVVALCDALALIGDPQAIGKLYQAMELAHRRIRVEAAAALAKLGESAGARALVALAAEPVVRLRVLNSAQELGLSDQVDPQYTTDTARAEAMVALELAQPTFFGVPPAELTLVDARTQFWPGYAEPIRCYLFRYAYRFAAGEYSNVAIAGPLVHAFAADLSDLPPDDIYAAYAGWHVEDESIYEVRVDALAAAHRTEQDRFERRLRDAGYAGVQSATLGHFFGDRILVAHAVRCDVPGIAVIDLRGIEWHPSRTRRHALGPSEAFCIYKGRRLLGAFNR
jgi:hypothetical protein